LKVYGRLHRKQRERDEKTFNFSKLEKLLKEIKQSNSIDIDG
jgi:hypothetical protein